MVAPISSNSGIDLTRFLVKDSLGVPVRANRRENRFPDIVLFTGAALSAERPFVVIQITLSCRDVAEIVAHPRLFDCLVRTGDYKGVLVLVEVNGRISAKIHRVGACDKSAIVTIRMED